MRDFSEHLIKVTIAVICCDLECPCDKGTANAVVVTPGIYIFPELRVHLEQHRRKMRKLNKPEVSA